VAGVHVTNIGICDAEHPRASLFKSFHASSCRASKQVPGKTSQKACHGHSPSLEMKNSHCISRDASLETMSPERCTTHRRKTMARHSSGHNATQTFHTKTRQLDETRNKSWKLADEVNINICRRVYRKRAFRPLYRAKLRETVALHARDHLRGPLQRVKQSILEAEAINASSQKQHPADRTCRSTGSRNERNHRKSKPLQECPNTVRRRRAPREPRCQDNEPQTTSRGQHASEIDNRQI
jgi:hypothetical protein